MLPGKVGRLVPYMESVSKVMSLVASQNAKAVIYAVRMQRCSLIAATN